MNKEKDPEESLRQPGGITPDSSITASIPPLSPLLILADYANDLTNLKKRDGMLPAQAAVVRLEKYYSGALR